MGTVFSVNVVDHGKPQDALHVSSLRSRCLDVVVPGGDATFDTNLHFSSSTTVFDMVVRLLNELSETNAVFQRTSRFGVYYVNGAMVYVSSITFQWSDGDEWQMNQEWGPDLFHVRYQDEIWQDNQNWLSHLPMATETFSGLMLADEPHVQGHFGACTVTATIQSVPQERLDLIPADAA